MHEIPVTARSVEPFEQVIGEGRTERFRSALSAARECLSDRAVWHVNSTASGGGVAEVLNSVLGYPASAGIDIRRLVIDGSEAFFELTKRIHHLLHGHSSDGEPLGERQRALYAEQLGAEVEPLSDRVRPGDVVVLHDPQVLGLAGYVRRLGGTAIWSCHVGADNANSHTRRAWDFLRHYVADTAAQTFSRSQYRWENLELSKVAVMPPCIDAFAPKNQPMSDAGVRAILDASGVIPSHDGSRSPNFLRPNGTTGSVTRRACMIEDQPLLDDHPIVCQVSRWDPLKDHLGVMHAFVSHVLPDFDAQLVLAGPAPDSVGDDPEGNRVFGDLVTHRQALRPSQRKRIHICSLPMDDPEENGAIVNALQRRSDVIVQKSLAEGFGLTVAEAMWKKRPVIGSRVGGIQDQIESGKTGLMVDPADPATFGSAVASVLADSAGAAKLGEAARRRVIADYLAPSYLTKQFELIRGILEPRP